MGIPVLNDQRKMFNAQWSIFNVQLKCLQGDGCYDPMPR